MRSNREGENKVQKLPARSSAQVRVTTTLPEAMSGKASPAKAAVGDEPVFAYIASLPEPQRGIAETVDALAAKTLTDLRRSTPAARPSGNRQKMRMATSAGAARSASISSSSLTSVSDAPAISKDVQYSPT